MTTSKQTLSQRVVVLGGEQLLCRAQFYLWIRVKESTNTEGLLFHVIHFQNLIMLFANQIFDVKDFICCLLKKTKQQQQKHTHKNIGGLI